MRTQFSPSQLADPRLAEVERNLRACVHCGICTASCPTYILTGDERDGPRGRIVMMQNMLEKGGAPAPQTVHHIDRCLSCLGCRTACGSSVDYARLVDQARAHIELHHHRPLGERLLRALIATVLTRPVLLRASLILARAFAPFAGLLPRRLAEMVRAGAATSMPIATHTPVAALPENARRVVLLGGCAQGVIAPDIDAAVMRLLARRGYRTVTLDGAGCCGALVHHLGRAAAARTWAQRLIEAFEAQGGAAAFDAVLISATGCSAHLKDYAHLFRGDARWEARAAAFAAKIRDLSEFLEPRPSSLPMRLRIAFQAPCSLQNGLKLAGRAEMLLQGAGFEVLGLAEGQICCGSAGSFSLLQPDLAAQLRGRKLAAIAATGSDLVATANIGCLNHLSGSDAPAIVHIAELIDWAEGGPKPVAADRALR